MKHYYHLAGITSANHVEVYRFYDAMTKTNPKAKNLLHLVEADNGELQCFAVNRSIFKHSLKAEVVSWIMVIVSNSLNKF